MRRQVLYTQGTVWCCRVPFVAPLSRSGPHKAPKGHSRAAQPPAVVSRTSRDKHVRLLNLRRCCMSPSRGTYSVRHPSSGFSFFTCLSKTHLSSLSLLLNFLLSTAPRHLALLFPPPTRDANLAHAKFGLYSSSALIRLPKVMWLLTSNEAQLAPLSPNTVPLVLGFH